MKLGIDVGGTNTDAVLLDGRTVISSAKSPTTADVIGGILASVQLATEGQDLSKVDAVLIGTTHFINAITQVRELTPVAVIRLTTPPQTLIPMVDWPGQTREALGNHTFVCHGGSQFDGSPLNPLDESGLKEIAARIGELGVEHIALSSVFSPVTPESEEQAAAVIREVLPHADISSSADIGRIGLLERENATILNACLRPLAKDVIDGFERVLSSLGISAPIFLSQNDGTMMGLAFARQFPIFTIASGPTNSMRGAAFLSGIEDGLVIDVGGTTSDIGMLHNGFPRESTIALSLGGVRSNFRMPDVLSLAIGGGTLVEDDGRRVGPTSVGYRLGSEALVFGGRTLTLTDIAVAAGVADIGDASAVAHLPKSTVQSALNNVRERLGAAVDRAKLSASDSPVIVVGGGSALLDELPGVSRLIRPDRAEVANAVGAAFAQVGGEVDRIFTLNGRTREQVLEEAYGQAFRRAVEAGADRDTIRAVDTEDVPLSHLPDGQALRVRVKVVGEMAQRSLQQEGALR
ncbi:MAG TPA: hydantoinase/oxoprolinase family protein [Jatrophihabitans sp.]|jgi:N-methylhydantoinase A/oxoprolinase/acetone carboxylase beta subunit